MAHSNVFRWISGPGLLGSLLLCHAQAYAQQDASVRLSPNEEVIQTWRQSNMGGSAPSLDHADDGGTRLEWKAGVTTDAYRNDIWSAGGSVNTPLTSGDFYKNVLNADLRLVRPDHVADYFQLGMTHSDDLSVLSQSRYQVNNLQFGRSGENYLVALGDIAPNFSSLSSSLGARGLFGQRQFGGLMVSGFTGMVAESWETLDNHVPRSQYLKDVHGIKLEETFGNLRVYGTTQAFSEREPSGPTAQPIWAARGKSRTVSGGFQYQKDQFTMAGETAGSHFEDDTSGQRHGRATIVDATWRGEVVGLRAGHHDIAPGFTSLSLAAQPGVRESYSGVDWTATSWVTFSTDLRTSRSTTLETVYAPSSFNDTDSVTARANITFGPDHPGWSLSLQQSQASSINSDAFASNTSDFSSTLNYSSPEWTAGLGLGRSKVSSEASPGSDSRTGNWAVSFGRNLTGGPVDLPPAWTASVNFSAIGQRQRLLAGGETANTSYTVILAAQRAGLGSLNLLMTSGQTTQPYGGPSLRLRGFQLEAVYVLKGQSTIKAFVRNTHRNIDDPLLSSSERVAGVQLVYNF